jgi:hypothetical protein
MSVSRERPMTTASKFASALSALKETAPPSKKQKLFLQAHYSAKNQTSTATKLATKVGYKNHGGINLQYGKLAKRPADKLGLYLGPDPYMLLLVEIRRPENSANDHYNLIMRDEFAKGLKSAGWVY